MSYTLHRCLDSVLPRRISTSNMSNVMILVKFQMSRKSASNTEQQVLQSLESTKFDIEKKRFSLPRQMIERKVTLRPYESFRDHKELNKHYISFGFAALSSEGNEQSSPTPSVFSIYGDDPGPSSFCEQPIGAQADLFISSLNEKSRSQIKKFLANSPRQDYQHFMWIKDHRNNKFTVVSIKTLENHLNSDNKVRRVQWRHLSSERVSVYRYSIPVVTYEKSRFCRDCIVHHKKLCLLTVWLSFVVFLCVVVVLGSLNPENRMHPFIHYQSNNTMNSTYNNTIS